MWRCTWSWRHPRGYRPVILAGVLALLWPRAGAGSDDWKFDVLRLKNGTAFRGLLIEEKPTEIRFRCVRRNPGSPTVVITTTFQRGEVAHIDKVDARERSVLEARLKALDPTGKDESVRMETVELERVPWLHKGTGEALRYTSDHFLLVSNAREDIVRRAAVRLEQIYAAYARFLPPRHQAGQPTTIYLVRSLDEYRALLRRKGWPILNPACYDAGHNQILCGSDLQRLGDDLERIRKDHQQILDDIKESEATLNSYYKGKIPAGIRNHFNAKRQEVYRVNLTNEAKFKEATRELFQTLYHEAFHAYLANFVYPPTETKVPVWLNEGLAQIFETALVEAGELRVGHADPDRLKRIKDLARKGEFPSLAELLRSGPKKFLVNHASDQQVSDRSYLHAWALAFYLTFDRQLLGSPALDRYAQALKRGTDPLEAFRQLTGQTLPQFEQEFHQYLKQLRPDGSTAKLSTSK